MGLNHDIILKLQDANKSILIFFFYAEYVFFKIVRYFIDKESILIRCIK